MITLVLHEADGVMAGASRVLRELSAAGLLGDLALVNVGDLESPGGPRAECVRAGEATETRLFDALAESPAVDGVTLTAVASADLAPEHQRDLAEAALGIAERIMKLSGKPAAVGCLFVPESPPGAEILPAAGFFSPRTANFVSLPTDWRFVDGVPVGIEYDDADRAAWHAALEVATITSAWTGVADSRWQPGAEAPGVADNSLRFVRAASRLVNLRAGGPRAATDGILPVPDGFEPSPVPGLVESTVPLLHPEEFRLEGGLSEGGDPGRSGPLMILLRAVGGVFPPLASGLRGFGRVLRDEVAKALGGDAATAESDEPPDASLESRPGEAPSVVLEGFDRGVWTDLVRDILGVADGGGTPVASEARRAAGHKQYVFVSRDSLLDDVLEQRLNAPGADGAENDPESIGAAERRGLLTLMDDAFRREVARAKERRSERQRERERLAEQVAQTERIEPPAALRTTLIAFFVTAFVVAASYMLLTDWADIGDIDPIDTLFAIAATALTWLVLQYPLAPRGDDPRAVQSYLLQSAAVVVVMAGLAAVFDAEITDAASRGPWLELIPVLAAAVTVWLAWRVLRSEQARERPAGRAVALAWTVCYLVSGLLLYANMERSGFNRWGWLRRFVELYGEDLRYAAAAIAGFLFLIAVAIFAVGDAGSDRRHRHARVRMREIDRELGRTELLPILGALRTNWLGTAVALDHILRVSFPRPSPAGETAVRLRSPLLRFAVRHREAHSPSPPPGWLFTRYERAVDAYSARRGTRSGVAGRVRPEAATMVSHLDRDPLSAPGADPRWDFAHRLRAGEFDDALAVDPSGAGDGSLLESDIEFLREIAPVAPAELPLGLLGAGAAALGKVAMTPTWWWPDGFAPPNASVPPRPARTGASDGGAAHIAVRLDVSDPILEGQLRPGVSPPEGPGPRPPDEGDEFPGRDDGLR
ncbi:MAG: hypothetical protein OXH20_06340 [bacterium]|nr:hypothetical protein [bacterium]MDE0668385.1 hypothetical protein [bacterium]